MARSRSVAWFASLVRYMLTPVEATTAGPAAANPAFVGGSFVALSEADEPRVRALLAEMNQRCSHMIAFAEQFPALARWVKGYGHIEIGEQEGFGFVVRGLDSGGLVFENTKAKTLAEAIAALEKGLARWFKDEGIQVEPADRRQE